MATERPRQAAQQAQHDPTNPEQWAGTWDDPILVNKVLRWARDNAHLISPATACSALPDGCAVAINVVWLRHDADAHSVGNGKFGLLKNALVTLSNAAGVCWSPVASGRLDDGSDPRYVWWKAVGAWRHLDGTIVPVVGDKQIDLNDDSDQTKRILASGRSKESAEKTLMDMRAFILEHAQSKAELRGIRKALGIRSYTEADFHKPFVVCKLMYTGRSKDPVLARENAAAIRAQMLGGAAALFGTPAAMQMPAQPQPVALPPAAPAPKRLTAAPIEASIVDDDDYDPPSAPRTPRAQQAPAPAPDPAPRQAPPPPPASQPRPQAAPADGAKSGFVIPGGRSKGTDLVDADANDLRYWSERIGKGLDDGSSRFPQKDQALLAAINAEQRRRSGGYGGGGGGAPPRREPDRDAGEVNEDEIPF